MDEYINQDEIVKLLGIKCSDANQTIHNLINRGKLDGFPKPLNIRINRKAVYNRKRVLAYLNGDNKVKSNLAFDFLTGKYDPARIKAKREDFRRIELSLNKPKPQTTTVKVIGEW